MQILHLGQQIKLILHFCATFQTSTFSIAVVVLLKNFFAFHCRLKTNIVLTFWAEKSIIFWKLHQ